MLKFLRFISKIVVLISSNLGIGTGVTWSGEIALLLDGNILKKLIPQNSKVILIAGTNGKTTTAKMVQTVIEDKYTIIHNKSGANLLNGLVGTILVNSEVKNKKNLAFVFEIDESNLSVVLKSVSPDILVLLNLFRDQLDRYGEVDTIAKKWQSAIEQNNLKNTNLIVNGDDPTLAYLAKKSENKVGNIQFFGINYKSLFLEEVEHAVDSIFCPNCGARLNFSGVYLSHLGDYSCPKCSFSHPKLNLEASKIEVSHDGLYMVYNFLASTLVAKTLNIPSDHIASALKKFQPAFGRQEEINKDGKKIKILLSKNPAGFNASLRTYIENKNKGPLLLVLNDRIPDGRDVSWIYDVDFENLKDISKSIHVAGDRAYDLALRLKYAGISASQINISLNEAVESSLRETLNNDTLWILPTYSAMLEVRKILTGKSIL